MSNRPSPCHLLDVNKTSRGRPQNGNGLSWQQYSAYVVCVDEASSVARGAKEPLNVSLGVRITWHWATTTLSILFTVSEIWHRQIWALGQGAVHHYRHCLGGRGDVSFVSFGLGRVNSVSSFTFLLLSNDWLIPSNIEWLESVNDDCDGCTYSHMYWVISIKHQCYNRLAHNNIYIFLSLSIGFNLQGNKELALV